MYKEWLRSFTKYCFAICLHELENYKIHHVSRSPTKSELRNFPPPPPNRKEFYRFDCNFHWNLHHHLKQTYLRISRTLCAYVSQKESLMCNLTKRVSWLNYIHLVSHTTVSPCAAQYLNTLSGSQIINELLRDSEIVYVDDVERAAWEAFAICSNALLRHSFRRI